MRPAPWHRPVERYVGCGVYVTTTYGSHYIAALPEFARGYLAGLWAFAWWKDGTCYVGTTGMTFRDAAEGFLKGKGIEVTRELYGYGRAGDEH